MRKPVKTERLYAELKAEITERKLRPGSLLPRETVLAEARGVSRFTLREVLRRLEEESLIVRVRGHGTYVGSGPKTTDISMLIPCADWFTRSHQSSILTRHFISGVLAACSRHHCRLHTIEFSRTNSATDIDWSNLATLDANSRLIVFSFWYKNAFEFLRNCGCRVLVATAMRNWHLEFDAENYPDIPLFHRGIPANWSFLTPDLPGAARMATEYLIRRRHCRRPALALIDNKLLRRPAMLDGYAAALTAGMRPIAIELEPLRDPARLGELQKELGFDGLVLDMRAYGADTRRYGLAPEFPVVRYPSVIDATSPCILDDYPKLGELAVRALLAEPKAEEVYPLELRLD